MANLRLLTAVRNDLMDRITLKVDAGAGAGVIEIRTGTQPASPSDAATGTLLGTLTFSDPSFPASASGTITASAITQDSAADASGTASWARCKDSNGVVVFDCDVGATGSGATIELNTTNIVAGGPIQITSFTITLPAG